MRDSLIGIPMKRLDFQIIKLENINIHTLRERGVVLNIYFIFVYKCSLLIFRVLCCAAFVSIHNLHKKIFKMICNHLRLQKLHLFLQIRTFLYWEQKKVEMNNRMYKKSLYLGYIYVYKFKDISKVHSPVLQL